MEIWMFIFGLLLGAGVAWFLGERYRKDQMRELEAVHEGRLKQLQDELKQADAANAETRERLIALQMEHKALQERLPPLEAELAQAKRAAEQAAAGEARANATVTALREEVGRLRRQLESRVDAAVPAEAGGGPAAPPAVEGAARPAAAAPVAATPASAGMAPAADSIPSGIVVPAAGLGPAFRDDLTRIKGIGKVIERKLHELGITTFKQIAELSPDDIRRIDTAIDFLPGRVEREHWVEQARKLLAS